MATDRVLIDATNETFWQLTGYKRGQRLDMRDPQDVEKAKTWRDIYSQLAEHRTHATQAAQSLATERKIPYIVVVEQRNPQERFGNLHTTAFETRNAMDVQYVWALEQPDYYTYLAAFDFTINPNAPVYDQFAVIYRLKSGTMTSGWWHGY
jgi:hypothetical protein